MTRPWEVDMSARFQRRLGRSPTELGDTVQSTTCPDIGELDNGDIAVVGRDVTSAFADRLPSDLVIGDDERLVVLPRNMLTAAKPDIPDA